MSIQKLHYENLGGMLIRREGLLNWRCPLCKAEGQSPEVMRACPECGSKEATLPVLPTPSVPAVTATAYRWRYRGAIMWQYGELTEETARLAEEHNHEVQPLYAEPISARPAPSIRPAALFPVIAWLRNGCDPMKAADELEMLAEAPEAKP